MRPIAQALLSRKKPLFTMTLFFGNKKGGQMGRLIFTLYIYLLSQIERGKCNMVSGNIFRFCTVIYGELSAFWGLTRI